MRVPLRIAAVVVSALLIGGIAWWRTRPIESAASRIDPDRRGYTSNDPIERGCALSPRILERIDRGIDESRSEDVVVVPQKPNYTGSFDLVNHSGPWDYLSRVPLVLYGPRIEAVGRVEREASLVDVYPTVGKLAGVDLPSRAGAPLEEALRSDVPGVPRLIVTLVWDAGGRNVLDAWPDRWPFLASLEERGTSYRNASVGSSPTITPSIHTTLGTGTYPRRHGVTGIYQRDEDGAIVETFRGRDPSVMRIDTYGDRIDRAYGNRSKVGGIGWRAWQIGMVGKGAFLGGGDRDELAIFRDLDLSQTPDDQFLAPGAGYRLPPSLAGTEWSHLQDHAAAVDAADGKTDGTWLGHYVLDDLHDNPTWVRHQTDAVLRMVDSEGYGRDAIPDLLFANFKVADTVGHRYFMDSKEMAGVVGALDDALEEIVTHLDETVGDYVLILTADHGHTPPPRQSGGWPISTSELSADIDDRFAGDQDGSIVEDTVGVGIFLRTEAMSELDVSEDDVARFVNAYTLRENWPDDDLPAGYSDRADEQVFQAAWGRSQHDAVMSCAFP